jgi:hypothetical protein
VTSLHFRRLIADNPPSGAGAVGSEQPSASTPSSPPTHVAFRGTSRSREPAEGRIGAVDEGVLNPAFRS